MRIVTLNTWKNEGDYPRRLDLMAHGLAALSPDVVCLQECFAGAGQDTAAHLSGALGLWAYARPSRAKSRPHDGRLVASTSGLAILSRGAAIAEDARALSSHVSDGDRMAQRLDLAAEGRRLRVLNLHLTHLRGPGFEALRGRQLAEALHWAAADHGMGLVVAGDLNAAATAPELAALDAQAAFEGPTFLGGRAERLGLGAPAVDHLVLQTPAGWRVASRRRTLDEVDADGWLPSDHAAVVVDLATV